MAISSSALGTASVAKARARTSASFVRNYEPVVVVTAQETYNGVPLEETEESILLATGADEQIRVARDAIE